LSTATAAETDHTLDSPACDKEQFRLKFGAQPTYTLLTAPLKPAIQNGFVVAKVRILFEFLCCHKSLVHDATEWIIKLPVVLTAGKLPIGMSWRKVRVFCFLSDEGQHGNRCEHACMILVCLMICGMEWLGGICIHL
jgi:hypothetical protein